MIVPLSDDEARVDGRADVDDLLEHFDVEPRRRGQRGVRHRRRARLPPHRRRAHGRRPRRGRRRCADRRGDRRPAGGKVHVVAHRRRGRGREADDRGAPVPGRPPAPGATGGQRARWRPGRCARGAPGPRRRRSPADVELGERPRRASAAPLARVLAGAAALEDGARLVDLGRRWLAVRREEDRVEALARRRRSACSRA